jgi:hypothetical protein
MAVFWVVAPCSLVGIYQRFRGPCKVYSQLISNINKTPLFSDVLVQCSSKCSAEPWGFAREY